MEVSWSDFLPPLWRSNFTSGSFSLSPSARSVGPGEETWFKEELHDMRGPMEKPQVEDFRDRWEEPGVYSPKETCANTVPRGNYKEEQAAVLYLPEGRT